MNEAIKILDHELHMVERQYEIRLHELNEEKKILADLVSGVEAIRVRRDSIKKALDTLQEIELED